MVVVHSLLSQLERITGEDLGARYNASLDQRMNAGMPSMPWLYDRASKFMHERSGTAEDFSSILADIEGHLGAKELFLKYSGALEPNRAIPYWRSR